jgi:hypothetical protein
MLITITTANAIISDVIVAPSCKALVDENHLKDTLEAII